MWNFALIAATCLSLSACAVYPHGKNNYIYQNRGTAYSPSYRPGGWPSGGGYGDGRGGYSGRAGW